MFVQSFVDQSWDLSQETRRIPMAETWRWRSRSSAGGRGCLGLQSSAILCQFCRKGLEQDLSGL